MRQEAKSTSGSSRSELVVVDDIWLLPAAADQAEALYRQSTPLMRSGR